MLLDKDKVFKQETVTIAEFVEKYHAGVTPQAIKYAIEKDLVDYTKIGSVYSSADRKNIGLCAKRK